MTEMLKKAFEEASELPDNVQDRIAEWLIHELRDEHRWDESFAGSADTLKRLANQALAEHRDGKTLPLDPDSR